MTTLNQIPEKKPERAIARKLWIREMLDGEVVVTEGLSPNILKSARGDIGRVNIIGVVVSTDELAKAIVLDDGTGTIQARSFDKTIPFIVGAFVQIIGRPRTYQKETYIAYEVGSVVSSGWAEYRKKELGEPLVTEKKEVVAAEKQETEDRQTNAERIPKLITELDRGDGASVEEIIVKSKLVNAEAILEQLMMTGDIFEIRAGKVKVL